MGVGRRPRLPIHRRASVLSSEISLRLFRLPSGGSGGPVIDGAVGCCFRGSLSPLDCPRRKLPWRSVLFFTRWLLFEVGFEIITDGKACSDKALSW